MSGKSAVCRHFLGLAFSSACFFSANCATAQITPDRTLPNNSSVTINSSTFNITGGTQAGRNLFHSFQQFSVPTGGTASFKNGLDIQNIFSRVTGGSASSIDGIIQAQGAANVFFINPSGIVFGKNASLRIGGSFVATTANSIQFGNQGTFSASEPNNPALLTVDPSAFLFNQIAHGSIISQSIAPAGSDPSGNTVYGLKVPNGHSLLLLGGDVKVDGLGFMDVISEKDDYKNSGGLNAFDGRVELGAIAGAGKVDLNFVNNQLHLSVPDNIPRGDISLTNAASVDVSGNGSGTVAVTARNLEIKGGGRISAGVKLGVDADSSPPGDITLNTTGLLTIMYPSTVANKIQVTNGKAPETDVRKGNGGDINITSGDIYIYNRTDTLPLPDPFPSAIEAHSGGEGRAGNISLSATGSITIIGQESNFYSLTLDTNFAATDKSVPGGGDITLKANDSIYLNGAYFNSTTGYSAGNISVFGKKSVSITNNSFLDAGAGTEKGDSGKITVTSNGSVSIDRSSLGNNVGNNAGNNTGNGNATDGIPRNGNDINISGQSIFITGGSLVESSLELEGIKSGNINLWATDKIEISGYDPLYTGYNSDNLECCSGNRNRPFLYTTLRTSSLFGSLGQAGGININTPTLHVFNGAILRADSQNAFQGGNINVNANVVELRSGGQLFTNASSTGNAGNINLNNTERLVIDGTNPTFDKFNEIAKRFFPIENPDAMYMLGTTSPLSGISAKTTSSLGGNITINAPKLLLLRRNAQIAASAGTNGSGGNITLNAPNGFIVALPSENSDILANASQGSGGNISINALGIYGLKNSTKFSLDSTISEINASSEFGQKGVVQIKTPEIDPGRGVVALPTVAENSPKLVSSNCSAFNETAGGNNFIITGRGGLPPSPYEPLTSDAIWTDTRLAATTPQKHQPKSHVAKIKPKPIEIVPATGWVFNGKGEVTLISSVSNATSSSVQASCLNK